MHWNNCHFTGFAVLPEHPRPDSNDYVKKQRKDNPKNFWQSQQKKKTEIYGIRGKNVLQPGPEPSSTPCYPVVMWFPGKPSLTCFVILVPIGQS